MRVTGEMELWQWGGIECVLVHREERRGLVVQVRRQGRVLANTPCADPDQAAMEAERLYQAVSGEAMDERHIPEWLRKFRLGRREPVPLTVTRSPGGKR